MIAELLASDVAVVTGAGRGIGAAVARGLAASGAAVAALDIDATAAEATAAAITLAGGRALAHVIDIAEPSQAADALAAVRAALGPVSVLVNNAGINAASAVDADDFPAVLARLMHTNLEGTATMMRACLGDLAATGGRIVNIASIRSFRPLQNGAAYAASKAAIAQLTRAFAVELAPRGVRVNAVAPGLIDTAMTQATMQSPQRLDAHVSKVPLGRAGTPDEVVGAVLFLASSMSAYVTGAVVPVDGGYLAAG